MICSFQIYTILLLAVLSSGCELITREDAYLQLHQNNSIDEHAEFVLINTETNAEDSLGMSAKTAQNSTEKYFKNGKIAYEGLLGQNENINSDTAFNIGSITKFFASVSLIRLMDARPDLFPNQMNTKLSYFVPFLKSAYPKYSFIDKLSLRNNYDNITLLHILQHTSGIGNYKFKASNQYDDPHMVNEETFLENETNEAKFGNFTYSNIGVNLVGMILRATTNETFSKLVKKYVLVPLNLKQTLTYEDLVKTKCSIKLKNKKLNVKIAQSYAYYSGEVIPSNNLNWDSTSASMYSSVNDLTRFVYNVFTNEDTNSFMNKNMRQLRDIKPVFVAENTYYGVGQFYFPDGTRGHGGTYMGAHTFVSHDSVKNTSIALAISGEGVSNRIADLIMANGEVDKIPALSIEYIKNRVNTINYIRKCYTIEQMKSMNIRAAISPRGFYGDYVKNVWKKQWACRKNIE